MAQRKPPYCLAEIARLREVIKHPKRPRDPSQLGKMIVDIATGEVEDRDPTPERGCFA